jgi:hypothetical protein
MGGVSSALDGGVSSASEGVNKVQQSVTNF